MSFRRQSFINRYKAPIIVCTGALLTGLISFMVTVKIYDNNAKNNVNPERNNNQIVAKLSGDKLNNISVAQINNKENQNNEINNDRVEVLSDGGQKTIEEYNGEEEIQIIEIDEKEYNDFINILVQNEEDSDNQIIETIANVNKVSGEKEEKLDFIMPIEGEIGLNYATEKLIYSNTLEEWITHNGIDIIGEEAEPIKSIETGVIESVKMDPRYGNTIIIKHNEEYKSIYSNLSTTDLVYVGKKVEKGEIISGVGKGFGFESKEEPHVHLTILKNGESVNPYDLVK